MTRRVRWPSGAVIGVVLLLGACAGTDPEAATPAGSATTGGSAAAASPSGAAPSAAPPSGAIPAARSSTPSASTTTAPAAAATGGVQRHPDVIDARLERRDDGWDLAVTISSPYDTPERYADGWRVLDGRGNVLGRHELAHDHAGEQPFTRTQRGLQIPGGVETITVEGRDRRYGYGGDTVSLEVPG